jgi:hypothetical protein
MPTSILRQSIPLIPLPAPLLDRPELAAARDFLCGTGFSLRRIIRRWRWCGRPLLLVFKSERRSIVIGLLDVDYRVTHFACLDGERTVVKTNSFRTTPARLVCDLTGIMRNN